MLPPESEPASGTDRRKFLAACGKFAVVTPPAMTVLLSTSLTSTAIAKSGGGSGKGNNGYGNAVATGARTARKTKIGRGTRSITRARNNILAG